MSEYNNIFERISEKSSSDGDEIIAYIAYGIYKEQKREFLMRRKEEIGGTVPAAEIEIFHKTWTDGQINLVWDRATQALAQFAVSYADSEKQKAVRDALSEALKGQSLRQTGTAIVANIGAAVVTIFVYFALRFTGFDLIDQIKKLERIVPS